MVKHLGWSLRDIDETSVESILDFIKRLSKTSGKQPDKDKRMAYCDEVNFL